MAQVIKKGSDRKEIREVLDRLHKKIEKGFDAKSFCGVLKIEKDPLRIQKELRDEWG